MEDTISSARQELLDTLKRPDDFHDWLQGTHYPSRYLDRLEKADRYCMQSVILSDKYAQSTSLRRHKPNPIVSTRLRGSPRQERACAAESAEGYEEATNVEGTAEQGERVAQFDGEIPEQTPHVKVEDSEPRTAPSNVNSSRPRNYRRTGRLHNSAGYQAAPETTISSAMVRNQLRDSYYLMKDADAYGRTFPALLTPFNRSFFHVYNDNELPTAQGGSRSASPFVLSAAGARRKFPSQAPQAKNPQLMRRPQPPSGPPAFYPTSSSHHVHLMKQQ